MAWHNSANRSPGPRHQHRHASFIYPICNRYAHGLMEPWTIQCPNNSVPPTNQPLLQLHQYNMALQWKLSCLCHSPPSASSFSNSFRFFDPASCYYSDLMLLSHFAVLSATDYIAFVLTPDADISVSSSKFIHLFVRNYLLNRHPSDELKHQ